jgi:hypothetical protein
MCVHSTEELLQIHYYTGWDERVSWVCADACREFLGQASRDVGPRMTAEGYLRRRAGFWCLRSH